MLKPKSRVCSCCHKRKKLNKKNFKKYAGKYLTWCKVCDKIKQKKRRDKRKKKFKYNSKAGRIIIEYLDSTSKELKNV